MRAVLPSACDHVIFAFVISNDQLKFLVHDLIHDLEGVGPVSKDLVDGIVVAGGGVEGRALSEMDLPHLSCLAGTPRTSSFVLHPS